MGPNEKMRVQRFSPNDHHDLLAVPHPATARTLDFLALGATITQFARTIGFGLRKLSFQGMVTLSIRGVTMDLPPTVVRTKCLTDSSVSSHDRCSVHNDLLSDRLRSVLLHMHLFVFCYKLTRPSPICGLLIVSNLTRFKKLEYEYGRRSEVRVVAL
ncbi:hypothetical protein SCHPADRAFT_493775 [Schizopora paradoxa]|uniref:Uncharacterized protein n=1 Tax=Schizopora paradoxa TaxID=27342 RepID=A0A0H2RHC5_9AGAM|nr:hypothetical protein SCHPADRAFT_493775 [Schizopora paradoxa]